MMNQYTATLYVAGRSLELDNEGYMLFPDEWDSEVAEALADSINVKLTDEHRAVVEFVRDYFDTNQSVPEARFALKAMKEKLGKDKGTRKYLYQLIPYGYAQQTCKIPSFGP